MQVIIDEADRQLALLRQLHFTPRVLPLAIASLCGRTLKIYRHDPPPKKVSPSFARRYAEIT